MTRQPESNLPAFLVPPATAPMTPVEAALLDLLDRIAVLEQVVAAQAEVIRRQQLRLDSLERTRRAGHRTAAIRGAA